LAQVQLHHYSMASLLPTRRPRHLTAVEVKDYLERHDLQRTVDEMIAQVFALQPEEPVPYMIAYLRKHGGAPDEAPREEAAWQQKCQDLARAAAEREAALAARVALLERELRAAVENNLCAGSSVDQDQENAILRLTAENQQLSTENQRLLAYSARNAAVDLDSAEPYMFGHFADERPELDGEVRAEQQSEKPSEAPADPVDAGASTASTWRPRASASTAPTVYSAYSTQNPAVDLDSAEPYMLGHFASP